MSTPDVTNPVEPDISLLADRTGLLDYLWSVQDRHSYIRPEDISACSRALDVSTIEIEGIVSFYHFFSRQPVGHNTIYLNRSAVAECKGFERVREAFERATGATLGGIDPSGQFGLFETACIGLSDLEPAALIDFQPFTSLNSLKVKEIVSALKQGRTASEICDAVPDHVRFVPGEGRAILFNDYERGRAIARMGAMGPEGVIEEIDRSGLCGMGGAFFPLGRKLAHCRGQPPGTRYVVCNADEGEPGTFKDRVLINALPGLMLEGIVLAGYAVGAAEGFIYLRAEYRWLLDKLQQEVERFRRMKLLGRDVAGIRGFDFDIRIQLGAGSYVCGEETAMLNSMEGLRGEPRNKRCLPSERGYLQKPTVVNNVETLCAAARVIEHGAARFRRSGTENSPGTKLLSVSGDCRLPGVYEIEWGTTVGELLRLCEADRPEVIQVGGPSGVCISANEVNRAIALDDLPCAGSFMVFSRSRELLKLLQNYTRFFRAESCGLCTPCRAGNFILEKKLDLFAAGLGAEADLDQACDWGRIMQLTCRCGLGRSAPNALLTARNSFPEYFSNLLSADPEGISKGFRLEDAVREHERFSS